MKTQLFIGCLILSVLSLSAQASQVSQKCSNDADAVFFDGNYSQGKDALTKFAPLENRIEENSSRHRSNYDEQSGAYVLKSRLAIQGNTISIVAHERDRNGDILKGTQPQNIVLGRVISRSNDVVCVKLASDIMIKEVFRKGSCRMKIGPLCVSGSGYWSELAIFSQQAPDYSLLSSEIRGDF